MTWFKENLRQDVYELIEGNEVKKVSLALVAASCS